MLSHSGDQRVGVLAAFEQMLAYCMSGVWTGLVTHAAACHHPSCSAVVVGNAAVAGCAFNL